MNKTMNNNTKDDGGAAFPHAPYSVDAQRWSDGGKGISIRDYFAAAEKIENDEEFTWELCEALAGKRPEKDRKIDPVSWEIWKATWKAKIKFIRADAMLQVRKEGA